MSDLRNEYRMNIFFFENDKITMVIKKGKALSPPHPDYNHNFYTTLKNKRRKVSYIIQIIIYTRHVQPPRVIRPHRRIRDVYFKRVRFHRIRVKN